MMSCCVIEAMRWVQPLGHRRQWWTDVRRWCVLLAQPWGHRRPWWTNMRQGDWVSATAGVGGLAGFSWACASRYLRCLLVADMRLLTQPWGHRRPWWVLLIQPLGHRRQWWTNVRQWRLSVGNCRRWRIGWLFLGVCQPLPPLPACCRLEAVNPTMGSQTPMVGFVDPTIGSQTPMVDQHKAMCLTYRGSYSWVLSTCLCWISKDEQGC